MTDVELQDLVVSFVFLVLLWFDFPCYVLIPPFWNGDVSSELLYVRYILYFDFIRAHREEVALKLRRLGHLYY